MKYTVSDNLFHFIILAITAIITIAWIWVVWLIVKYCWPILLAFVFAYGIVEMARTRIKKGN